VTIDAQAKEIEYLKSLLKQSQAETSDAVRNHQACESKLEIRLTEIRRIN